MSTQTPPAGTLYVVATPIGNLADLSDRARRILGEVAIVAAEDTRHTGALLKNLGIEKPLVSLHEHNESARVKTLLTHLQSGRSIALVSDAGTPLISDPGFEIVREVAARGLDVVAIPGPSAVIAALSVAGLPTDRFAFEGFLPSKSAQRRERLASVCADARTLVFYEAPHRLEETLADIAAILGERMVVVARELTKHFETIYRGTAADLGRRAREDADMARGEIVIVVAGADKAQDAASNWQADEVLRILLAELPPAQAAKLTARITGAKRDDLYRRATELNAQKI